MRRARADSQIADLVIAVAEGTPVADWARQNNVPKRTAFRWARDPKLRARVESTRRQVLDQVVGRLTANISMVTEGILGLATGHLRSLSGWPRCELSRRT